MRDSHDDKKRLHEHVSSNNAKLVTSSFPIYLRSYPYDFGFTACNYNVALGLSLVRSSYYHGLKNNSRLVGVLYF
ncbi:hypothetical protein [Candidatus Nitrosotalea bavarica]|uniref:hypothetical protein n=1 Tax=Candidatus Nitrosotalea bavarica TaxID=1903277 RepID=UPI001054F594|nr:hypothetical protein [Candidatus Nitrosotalea bavarica]